MCWFSKKNKSEEELSDARMFIATLQERIEELEAQIDALLEDDLDE